MLYRHMYTNLGYLRNSNLTSVIIAFVAQICRNNSFFFSVHLCSVPLNFIAELRGLAMFDLVLDPHFMQEERGGYNVR